MKVNLFLSAGALLFLVACARESEETLPATTPPVTQTAPPATIPTEQTAQIWLDDFTLGTELAADGAIATGANENEFVTGQPIYLAMEVGDAPTGADVRVAWVGPNNTPIAEETKAVVPGQRYMSFTADSSKMPVGDDYRAEVWVEGQNVTQLEFDMISRVAEN